MGLELTPERHPPSSNQTCLPLSHAAHLISWPIFKTTTRQQQNTAFEVLEYSYISTVPICYRYRKVRCMFTINNVNISLFSGFIVVSVCLQIFNIPFRVINGCLKSYIISHILTEWTVISAHQSTSMTTLNCLNDCILNCFTDMHNAHSVQNWFIIHTNRPIC